MGLKRAQFSTYFWSIGHSGKKFLSNPLKSTQKIDFVCSEKLLKFVLDIVMVGFCLNCFIITCLVDFNANILLIVMCNLFYVRMGHIQCYLSL